MIIGPFVEDLFWRGNTLFWSREGIVCRKATFEATIRSAAAVRLQTRPAVLIVLDKHGRLLYDDGKIVDLFLPGKVDKCWALKDGALVEGQGIWGLWDVVEGFKRLEMEQGRILHVDERIFYDAGDLVIGTIESTTKQRDTLDYDVTMHAGLARESHVGQAIVAKQRLPFRYVHKMTVLMQMCKNRWSVCNGWHRDNGDWREALRSSRRGRSGWKNCPSG